MSNCVLYSPILVTTLPESIKVMDKAIHDKAMHDSEVNRKIQKSAALRSQREFLEEERAQHQRELDKAAVELGSSTPSTLSPHRASPQTAPQSFQSLGDMQGHGEPPQHTRGLNGLIIRGSALSDTTIQSESRSGMVSSTGDGADESKRGVLPFDTSGGSGSSGSQQNRRMFSADDAPGEQWGKVALNRVRQRNEEYRQSERGRASLLNLEKLLGEVEAEEEVKKVWKRGRAEMEAKERHEAERQEEEEKKELAAQAAAEINIASERESGVMDEEDVAHENDRRLRSTGYGVLSRIQWD